MNDIHPNQSTTNESSGTPRSRRRVLRTIGGVGAGMALFTGGANAHIDEGKGISWVAFCGCEGGFNIRYIRCNDEGELGAVAYDCDGGTVYYKAGRNIYRHEYTRRNEDNDPDNDTDGYHVLEIDFAGTEDPVASTTSSDSRDPCGILGGGAGTKLEEDEIRAQADTNNCVSEVSEPTSVDDGANEIESDDDRGNPKQSESNESPGRPSHAGS